MSSPSGHTHRLPSVIKGLEPDVSPAATSSLPGPFRPNEEFFWGVATSGYQAEGGYNGPGEPLNNWAWAEAAGDVVPSGRTSDFWNLSHEDFGRCRDLGLNAFRMSIEWSRVQPTSVLGEPGGLPAGAEPPPFDERALYSYAQRIADCRAHGLEPIITLHHFVWPAWLGLDAWLRPDTIDHFVAFVRRTVEYLLRTLPNDFNCPPPRWYITLNEPNLQAFNHYLYRIFPTGRPVGIDPTMECLGYLMEAHVRTYRLIHELYARAPLTPKIKPMVSFNNYVSDLYWSDTALLDLLHAPSRKVPRQLVREDLSDRARAFDARFNSARLFPMQGPRYYLGQGLKHLHHWLARRGFSHHVWDRLVNLLYESADVPMDYIAFDYYDPFIAHALRWPTWHDFETRRRSARDWILESVASKWWDWRMLPEGLAFFTRHLARYGLPLLIAENGMALRRLPDNSPFSPARQPRAQPLPARARARGQPPGRAGPAAHRLPALVALRQLRVGLLRAALRALLPRLHGLSHAPRRRRHRRQSLATYAEEIREARLQFAAAAQRASRKTGAREGSASGPASATKITDTRDSNTSATDSVQ